MSGTAGQIHQWLHHHPELPAKQQGMKVLALGIVDRTLPAAMFGALQEGCHEMTQRLEPESHGRRFELSGVGSKQGQNLQWMAVRIQDRDRRDAADRRAGRAGAQRREEGIICHIGDRLDAAGGPGAQRRRQEGGVDQIQRAIRVTGGAGQSFVDGGANREFLHVAPVLVGSPARGPHQLRQARHVREQLLRQRARLQPARTARVEFAQVIEALALHRHPPGFLGLEFERQARLDDTVHRQAGFQPPWKVLRQLVQQSAIVAHRMTELAAVDAG